MSESSQRTAIRSRFGAQAWIAAVSIIALSMSSVSRAEEVWSAPRIEEAGGEFTIRLHGRPFVQYVYRDKNIPRPYFANLRLPGGIQVTRNHPPASSDANDHAQLHPGLWLAFGDLAGHDYWRLRAQVEHLRFVEPPSAERDRFGFAVENRYLNSDADGEVCREIGRYEFRLCDQGILLQWHSTFRSDDQDFYFGDQEEMGLGVRLATPIAVSSSPGGRILNSHGQQDEEEAWGQAADWCDYGGIVDGKFVGVLLMPHPSNFRPCWFHARDYGFVAANPFGQQAFGAGEPSRIVVPKGQPFSMRYGVYLHWNASSQDFDPAAIYEHYVNTQVE